MIDLSTPDTLLYDSAVLSSYIRKNTKESFGYIFFDNIDYITKLYNDNRMRDVTYKNILDTILCGSVYLGFDTYECPDCGFETTIPHTCKSRFCSKCAAKSAKQRSISISAMTFSCKHRHIVFTVAQELRDYFIRDRSLLDLLFIASRNTISALVNDAKFRKNKRLEKHRKLRKSSSPYLYKDTKDNVVFGAISTLHTFGRPLEFNPHIHMLVCQDALNLRKDCIKSLAYMDFNKLRKTWMYQILDLLDRKINTRQFHALENYLYKNYPDGFYVYAKEPKRDQSEDDVDDTVAYITRYTNRPVMAESRIVEYNDTTKMIHWFYNRHEDDKRIDVTERVERFIQKVIRHCPDENFKMTRYYGFYSNRSTRHYNRMAELLAHKQKKETQYKKERQAIAKIQIQKTHFRYFMIQSFQRDPIKCRCGMIMNYAETYNPFEGGRKNDIPYKERCIYTSKYLRSQTISARRS